MSTQRDPLVLAARDVARGFSAAISRVKFGGRRVLVTRQGRPAAAIVSIEDLARLQAAPGGEGTEGER